MAPTAPWVPLWLCNTELRYVPCAEYLGVNLSATSVTDAQTLERIRNAEKRLRQLQASGMRRPRISALRLRTVYAALLKPVWTYGLHLTPLTDAVEQAAARFLDEVTKWVCTRLAKHSRKRARRLLAIQDTDVARRRQMKAAWERMYNVREKALESGWADAIQATTADAATAAALVEETAEMGDPVAEQLRRWNEVESSRRRKRKLAPSSNIAVHTVWMLPTARHSTCAANWLFGRLPAYVAAARWYVGEAAYSRLDQALKEAFGRERWTAEVRRSMVVALERLSGFWPVPLASRRREARVHSS